MLVILQIILGSSFIALACFTRAMYLELKETRAELEKYKKHCFQIAEQLMAARKKINALKYGQGNKEPRKISEPRFLLADDPMEALLNEVGKVKK